MSVERKERWKKEVDWLLSVTDYIVEFVPSQQKSKDGTDMEVKIICHYGVFLKKRAIFIMSTRRIL